MGEIGIVNAGCLKRGKTFLGSFLGRMMMRQIERTEVFALMAKAWLLFNSREKLLDLLEITDKTAFDETKLDSMVLDFISTTYGGIQNGYLSEVYQAMTGQSVEVAGQAEAWYACPCCGWKTLSECYGVGGGGYDICRHCAWEDDGIRAEHTYSSVNRSSIAQWRQRLSNNPNIYLRNKWAK